MQPTRTYQNLPKVDSLAREITTRLISGVVVWSGAFTIVGTIEWCMRKRQKILDIFRSLDLERSPHVPQVKRTFQEYARVTQSCPFFFTARCTLCILFSSMPECPVGCQNLDFQFCLLHYYYLPICD